MKKAFFALILLTSAFLLSPQEIFAQKYPWGYYYSYDNKSSMQAYISEKPNEQGQWTLDVTIEGCNVTAVFQEKDDNYAAGDGYTFTFNELSPAIIVSLLPIEATEENLAKLPCGHKIVGTYAHLCPEAQSPMKQMDITIKDVLEPSIMDSGSIVYTHNGIEDYILIPKGSLGFFQKLSGKTVNVLYKNTQYYDEHDNWCTREIELYEVNGVRVQEYQKLS